MLAAWAALYIAAFTAGVSVLGRYSDRAADVVIIGTVLGMTVAVPHYISRGLRAARYEPAPRDGNHRAFMASLYLLGAAQVAIWLLIGFGASPLYGAAVFELFALGSAGFALLEYLSLYTERTARVSPPPVQELPIKRKANSWLRTASRQRSTGTARFSS